MAFLEGPPREVKAGCGWERQDPRSDAFIQVHGWSALGFPGQGKIGQFKLQRVQFGYATQRSYQREAGRRDC